MKKILIAITAGCLLLPMTTVNAQDIQSGLDKALSSYNSENLEDARFALQQALNDINQAIGREVLNLLPAEMNGMSRLDQEDNVTGTSSGFAGLYVNRSYQGENRDATIEIVSDSPMLGAVSTLLNLPGFMTSDPNQKRIKLSNYKALMTKEVPDSGLVSYNIQMPFENSLMTFSCRGVENEDEVIEIANRIPVDKIVKITR